MKLIDEIMELARKMDLNLFFVSTRKGEEAATAGLRPVNQTNNSYSVAKVFTLTAIGMLCDRGLLNLERPVADYFTGILSGPLPKGWENVTVENVIRHRAGFQKGFLDIDTEPLAETGTTDFLQRVFSEPIFYQPGTEYVYSDAAYYLLSRLVTAVTGEKLDDFLIRELFRPLKFSEYAFSKCPMGYPIGATGLYLRTPDMVKLGQLYALGGVMNGRRYLSNNWTERVFAREYEFSRSSADPESTLYAKGGMYGQMLMLCRKTGRTVAWHAFETDERTGEFFSAVCELCRREENCIV